MKQSPLQLLRYVVPEVSCSANSAYDPAKPCDSAGDNFSVNAVVVLQEAPPNFPGHSWSVEMTISQKLKEGANFPYKFDVALIAFYRCKDGFPTPAAEEKFVRVNGSSMLYGAARELLRSLTCRGPWGEIFLPTLSFYDNHPKPATDTPAPKSPEPPGPAPAAQS